MFQKFYCITDISNSVTVCFAIARVMICRLPRKRQRRRGYGQKTAFCQRSSFSYQLNHLSDELMRRDVNQLCLRRLLKHCSVAVVCGLFCFQLRSFLPWITTSDSIKRVHAILHIMRGVATLPLSVCWTGKRNDPALHLNCDYSLYTSGWSFAQSRSWEFWTILQIVTEVILLFLAMGQTQNLSSFLCATA